MTPTTDELLAKVPLFKDLSKKHLQKISGIATSIDADAGKVLTREGETGHEFIIILEGEVEVRRGDEVIATRRAGDYIGEISLIEHQPRTATVIATTHVVIEVIAQREFAALLATEPDIAEQIRATSDQRRQELGDAAEER